ncbi:uncharacterized protein LOC118741813 [Rhagoletis pomonella]|uniref:uncharacterized protein LOC118741813 n=1 Tax=Rhagoletis pomonella TaxID=28610 RepID=UPI00177BC36C|nr:uncharacterized protein LOC118741813 [Rhagoletis pomonella]
MCTLMTQIEAVLNSRPLTPLSEDPNDFQVLTPSHFLIGETLTTLADSSENHCYHGVRDHWKAVQRNSKEFWKRWSLEYLSELQKRVKWQRPQDNLPQGSLVLLKEENLPTMTWRRGRVENLIIGKDGKCRMVDVRTSTGMTKRSITNVCPFPTETERNISKNEESHKNRNVRHKNKNVLMTMLTFLLVLPLYNCQVIIEKFRDKSGILIERQDSLGLTKTSWEIIIHVNMTDYQHQIQLLMGTPSALQKLAKLLDKGDSESQKVVETLVNQVIHRIKEVNQKDALMRFNGRNRASRSILPFVGSVYHSVFGLMDEEHADELVATIKRTHKNEEYLLKLYQNQSSIEDITQEVLKKKNEKAAENELAMEGFQNYIASINIAIESIEQLQGDITDLIWNSKGNFMKRILPIDRFQTQIATITANLNDDLQLPDTDPFELSKISRVTATINQGFCLVRIQIPLIQSQQLQLFALTSYPILHDGYFKVRRITLCPQIGPLYNVRKDQSCELELFFNSKQLPLSCVVNIMPLQEVWLQLKSSNSWLYSVPEDTKAEVSCGSSYTAHILVEQGIVKLQPGCHLTTAIEFTAHEAHYYKRDYVDILDSGHSAATSHC